MTSRRYIKRIWRVPKDRGPAEYLATLVCKLLRKHGWPAEWNLEPFTGGFSITHHWEGSLAKEDFWNAVETAVRITARTYAVEVENYRGFVSFIKDYRVHPRGVFIEVKE